MLITLFYHSSSLFLLIDFYVLILAVIEQFFNPTVGMVIPLRIVTNEANAEIETQPLTKF